MGATEIKGARGEGRNGKEGENGGGDDFGCLEQRQRLPRKLEDTFRVAFLRLRSQRGMWCCCIVPPVMASHKLAPETSSPLALCKLYNQTFLGGTEAAGFLLKQGLWRRRREKI